MEPSTEGCGEVSCSWWVLVWGCTESGESIKVQVGTAGHAANAGRSLGTLTPPGVGRCPLSLKTRQRQDSNCPSPPGPLFISDFCDPTDTF